MSKNKAIITTDTIQDQIFSFRGTQAMIDRDLADMYQVAVKRLNEQVKRNKERFPESFRFQLSDTEKNELVANCDRFESLKHASVNPYVFTEQGVAMLSAILRSDVAVKVSIQIIQAFVEMRKFITIHEAIFKRLDSIELKQLKTDDKFEKVFKALESGSTIPKQGIFFDGQVFDAYTFVAGLIRKATKTIVLIDNYVDETVLTLLSKKQKQVKCTVLTKNISKQMMLDADKFNRQYPVLQLKKFNKAHDRFLIIDETEVYHIGASLKDLGKKWFAFSKMDKASVAVVQSIKELI